MFKAFFENVAKRVVGEDRVNEVREINAEIAEKDLARREGRDGVSAPEPK